MQVTWSGDLVLALASLRPPACVSSSRSSALPSSTELQSVACISSASASYSLSLASCCLAQLFIAASPSPQIHIACCSWPPLSSHSLAVPAPIQMTLLPIARCPVLLLLPLSAFPHRSLLAVPPTAKASTRASKHGRQ